MELDAWGRFGAALGDWFSTYAVFLLLGCVGIHVLVGIVYGWLDGASPRRRLGRLAIELVYCLLHPVLYLVVFEAAFFRKGTSPRLQAISWSLLLGYWAFRLAGPTLPLGIATKRRLFSWLVTLCGVWVVVLAIRDAIIRLVWSADPIGSLFPSLLCAPLYCVPIWVAWTHRQIARSPERWAEEGPLVGTARWTKGVSAVGLVSVFGVVAFASIRPSVAKVEAAVVAQRPVILTVARKYQVDPRLIAALYYVTQRDYVTSFRGHLEEASAGAWLTDPHSHFALSGGLDPSLGVTQIKPMTLITARVIRRWSAQGKLWVDKQERDVPSLGDAWKRLPDPKLTSVPFAEWIEDRDKSHLVAALLTPEKNLEACAFLLDLYATQWESVNPAWSIRDRPEILATLFQIGFERSHPKAEPRPNEFGKAVAEAMREPWLQASFGPSGR